MLELQKFLDLPSHVAMLACHEAIGNATRGFVDFLDTTHDTAQYTVYEMKIPYTALGTTKDTVKADPSAERML